MLFNTVDFVLFLPLVIIGYFLVPAKFRWILLLAASYYFYMSWKIEYIVLIIFSTLVDYICALGMGGTSVLIRKRMLLIISVCTNLGLLFGFKYFNFFTGSMNEFFQLGLPNHNLLLPVGISFYTFQTMSYSIDVYNGKLSPEKHLGYFALYVSFFPQLVAGPIERFSSLTPQLRTPHPFLYDNLKNGLRLILFGLFAKMVIADNLGPIVDAVYANPELYSSGSIATSMAFYSFQIYCDFFGYSLIAIGSALIMGVRLMDNFKTPYLAVSISEFWQRWHISLSTWFRDYLYFPLGGNRVAFLRWTLNIFIVFILSGFWHGANFTFLFWGLIFALAYIIENLGSKFFGSYKTNSFSIKHILLMLKTFIIVTIAWVFFRSDSMAEAFNLFYQLFANFNIEGKPLELTYVLLILFGLFILFDFTFYSSRFDSWINGKHVTIRWSIYSFLIFSVIVLAGVEDFPFIYFQF